MTGAGRVFNVGFCESIVISLTTWIVWKNETILFQHAESKTVIPWSCEPSTVWTDKTFLLSNWSLTN